MNKLFLCILIFAIISFLTTGILINKKINSNSDNIGNNNNSQPIGPTDNTNENKNEENTDISQIKEKTIDLDGTYDENDLKTYLISEFNETVGDTINFLQIDGLKNKDVENKINEDIKLKINQKIKEIYAKEKCKDFDVYTSLYGNFANVLSLSVTFSYKIDEKYKSEDLGLNYELLNGENLKFEDLFVKNTDINSIVRRILYRTVEQKKAWNFDVYGIEFDKDKGEWTGLKWEYDESTGGSEYRDIYIPEINDYEIYKMMNKFINSEDKQFYFSPSVLNIRIENSADYHLIDFFDIANDIVIYDKYLTEESIFENENIGRENLFTCSEAYRYDNNFLQYGLAEENLFYEILEGHVYMENGYLYGKSVDNLKNQMLIELENRLEEYKKIAKNNPDKFYVVSLIYQIETDNNTNIIPITLTENCGHVNFENKDKVIEDIKDCYRYYNVVFYGSGLGLYFERNEYYNEYMNLENKETKIFNKVYDARNLKEITSVEEIFRVSEDCENILKQKFEEELKINWHYKNYDANRRTELVEEATFEMNLYGIEAKFPNEEYTVTIRYDDFGKELFNIYDVSVLYLLPSNTRLIEISEIENLSLEDLNIAYNEIFARHGHDFKSNELKSYFNNLSWYYPIDGKAVSREELNEIEKTNLDIIKNMIDKKKAQ